MKSVIKMNNNDAKDFFLKKESYFNLELPEYYNLENIIGNVMSVVDQETDFKKFKCGNPRDYESINYKMIYNKDGKYGWRPFEIIHPLKYIELVSVITNSENWTIIKKDLKITQKIRKLDVAVYLENHQVKNMIKNLLFYLGGLNLNKDQ